MPRTHWRQCRPCRFEPYYRHARLGLTYLRAYQCSMARARALRRGMKRWHCLLRNRGARWFKAPRASQDRWSGRAEPLCPSLLAAPHAVKPGILRAEPLVCIVFTARSG